MQVFGPEVLEVGLHGATRAPTEGLGAEAHAKPRLSFTFRAWSVGAEPLPSGLHDLSDLIWEAQGDAALGAVAQQHQATAIAQQVDGVTTRDGL